MTIDHAKFSPIELLHVRYAENRIAIREITKQIKAMYDLNRPDQGIDLDEIRTEYLDDGDQWRGWAHAIEHVEGLRDPEDDEPITEDQKALASLLDQKAALRVEAGKIKRAIFVMGERLIKLGALR